MADADLVAQSDIEASLLRPLTTAETPYIDGLITQASDKLRAKVPAIDADIQAWADGARTAPAVSAGAVAAMLAGVIKRVLINPKGLWSESDTTGPLSHSYTYAADRNAGGATPAQLTITTEDLAQLWPQPAATAGTIRLRTPHHGYSA